MGQRTSIEWTDVTWNPTTGCTRVSAGCDNCYADAVARRLLDRVYTRRLPAVDTPENRADPFAVRIWPERVAQPSRWRKPRLVFVNSMSDLFHKQVPDDFVREVFRVMADVPRHTYQVLTKRPARAARFVRRNADLFGSDGLPPHIWMGTSTENQQTAYRVRHLQDVPAAVRFLSCEPLIGPLRLDGVWSSGGIHWVIAGGESGPGHRPVDPHWVRNLRDECVAAGVPFFFKQWGGRTPKSGGRKLEGREWNEFPAPQPAARSRCGPSARRADGQANRTTSDRKMIEDSSLSGGATRPKDERAVSVDDGPSRGELILYATEDGRTQIQLRASEGTVWLTQAGMAELFDTTKQNISLHLRNLLREGELGPAVVKQSLTTAHDGKSYLTKNYKLEASLAVGYGVRSPRGPQFRRWATTILREYLVKGASSSGASGRSGLRRRGSTARCEMS